MGHDLEFRELVRDGVITLKARRRGHPKMRYEVIAKLYLDESGRIVDVDTWDYGEYKWVECSPDDDAIAKIRYGGEVLCLMRR